MNEDVISCPLCGGTENSYKRTLKFGSRLLACSTCSLQFVNPFPILDQNVYDQNYYRSWGMEGNTLPDHVKRLKEANMRKHITNIQKYAKSGSILEVGSAVGFFLKVACEEGFDVTGLDLSHQACQLAQTSVPDAKVLQGALETVGLESESFDVIFLSDVIEHIPRPAHFWRTATRLLKKKGIVYIITPNPEHWSCFLAGSSWVHYKKEHLIFYSQKTIEWVCAKYDLKLIEQSWIYKRTNLAYFSTQVKQFGPKYLERGISLMKHLLPPKWTENLFPLPLGETKFILLKL